MSMAKAKELFNQVVSGERQSVTPEEALAFPDAMLESEPQPKLSGTDAGVRSKVMREFITRQEARRKIAAVKKTAQVERQAEERRAARVSEAQGFEPPIAQTSADENTITRVDPRTLQPIAAPRISPDRFTLGRRNRRFTGKPTKAWVEVLQEREARNPTGDNPELGRTYAAAIKDFFETKANAAFRKYRGYYIQAAGGVALVEDTTVHTDKEAVLNLLTYPPVAHKEAPLLRLMSSSLVSLTSWKPYKRSVQCLCSMYRASLSTRRRCRGNPRRHMKTRWIFVKVLSGLS